MNEKNGQVVTLRPKRDKKDISQEPEMKELKRMVRDGELDPDRTIDHLKEKENTQKVRSGGAGGSVTA